MRVLAGLLGLVLGPLWLFQLRANLVAFLGSWQFVPDLLALGAALAALRLSPAFAVSFGAAVGLLSDICGDGRFGAQAARDALLVALFLPLRRHLFSDSRATVFVTVFGFVLVQKLATASLLIDGVTLSGWALWLPRVLAISTVTALTALPLSAGFEALCGEATPRRGRRSPRLRFSR